MHISFTPPSGVSTTDPRLSNARTPTAHIHSANDITTDRLNPDRLPIDVVRSSGRVPQLAKASVTLSPEHNYVSNVGTFMPGVDAPGALMWTLPSAITYGTNKTLIITDESYSLRPWFRIMLTPQAGERLNGQVNGTYPMTWGGQAVTLVSTINGWLVVSSNINPTPYVTEQPSHGRGMVCVENDFGDYMGGSQGAGYRAIGNNGGILSVTGNPANTLRVLAMTAGGAAGHGCRLVTTAGGLHETRSRKTGEWVEWQLASLEVGDATHNSIHEFGITSYSSGSPLADAADGCYFRFERLSAIPGATTNWLITSVNGGVATVVNSGVAYADAGNGARFGIQLMDGTAGAHFYFNDTYCGFIGTNAPGPNTQISPTAMTRWVSNVGRSVFFDRLRHQFRIADVAARMY